MFTLMNISCLRWLKELSHFKAFYNDWLDYEGLLHNNGRDHIVNLPVSFFNELQFDSISLKQYRIDAARLCAETLGDNPALCFSGGADSQAMLQSWHEANLKFDTFIVVFNDGLNNQDSDHAIQFCKQNGYPYKELHFNVIQFLNRDNYEYGKKYNSCSPHFNVHYRVVEILRDMGYTGVCNGGDAPYNHNDVWGENFAQRPFHYLKIQDKIQVPFQGSFLSFYPQLAWAIALLTESRTEVFNSVDTIIRNWELEQEVKRQRYIKKIDAYRRVGFNVLPQETKFTGFELVKKYYEDLTGDGWTFERKFRHPLVAELDHDKTVYKFNLTPDQLEVVNLIQRNNLRPAL